MAKGLSGAYRAYQVLDAVEKRGRELAACSTSRSETMPLANFAELFRQADAARAKVRVVSAGGADATVLETLRTACDRGWVRPQVTGSAQEITRLARDGGIALDGIEILDSDDPAGLAVARVRDGAADLLMKGQIATPALMQAVLRGGLRTERVICQVVLMEIVPAKRCFLLADTGICPRPTLEQKIDILQSAVTLAQALGAQLPRVAVMAASEKATEVLPDTLEAAEIERRARTGELSGCVVQGPMSFDLAYDAEAGQRKHLSGDVAGRAEVLLFPDLTSANLTVKAIMYTADCRFGGVLLGAKCPVVFMSRADSTQTRLHSLALALSLSRRTC